MLSEPSNLPSQYPAPELPPNVRQPAAQPAVPTSAQPTPQPQQPAQSQLRRPGCVTATSLMLFLLGFAAVINTACTLVLLDAVQMIRYFGMAVLLTGTAIGLWHMYRWAVNLTLLYCGMQIARMIGFTIFSAILVGDYLANTLMQFAFVMVMVIITGIIGVLLVLVMRWFFKTRHFFQSNNLFPKWESSLYIIAIGILLMELILFLGTAPEAFELQRDRFEALDSQSRTLDTE